MSSNIAYDRTANVYTIEDDNGELTLAVGHTHALKLLKAEPFKLTEVQARLAVTNAFAAIGAPCSLATARKMASEEIDINRLVEGADVHARQYSEFAWYAYAQEAVGEMNTDLQKIRTKRDNLFRGIDAVRGNWKEGLEEKDASEVENMAVSLEEMQELLRKASDELQSFAQSLFALRDVDSGREGIGGSTNLKKKSREEEEFEPWEGEEEEEREQWVIVLWDKGTEEYEFAGWDGKLSPEAPDAEKFDSEAEAQAEAEKIQKKYPDKEVSLRTWSYLGTGRI